MNKRKIIREEAQPLGEHNPRQLLVRTDTVKDIIHYPFEHLNPMQSSVVEILEEDCNVIITSPTASGKTVAMEMFVAQSLKDYPGSAALCLFPLKSLTEEKLNEWTDETHTFGSKDILPITGDHYMTDEKKEQLNTSDIIVATSEMLDSKTRNYSSNKWLDRVKILVVDEVHLIGSENRGPKLESALMRFCKHNPDCRVIFMSATAPNKVDLLEWLETICSKRKTVIVESEYRPCLLDRHFVEFSDGVLSIKSHYSQIDRYRMVACKEQMLKNPKDQHIIFSGTKSWGYKFKEYLKAFGIESGFHNADLSLRQRSELESKFKNNEIKYLISTSTLAWGCYKKGSFVQMSNGAMKNVEDLKCGDLVKSFNGREFSDDAIRRVESRKIDKFYRVTMCSGEVCDVSPEHLFYSAAGRESPGWNRVENLSSDDYVAVPSTYKMWDGFKFDSFGYALGYAVGDGCLVRNGNYADGAPKYSLDICSGIEDLDNLKIVHKILCDYFSYDVPFPRPDQNGVYHIVTKCRKITDEFLDCLLTKTDKSVLDIPNDVIVNKNMIGSYLKGLFDADGGVCDHGNGNMSVELNSISPALVRKVQQILLCFGIRSEVGSKRIQDTIINGRYQPARRELIWRLRIYGKNANNFLNRIGFCLSRKQDMLRRLCESKQYQEYNCNDLVPVRHLLRRELKNFGASATSFKVDLWNIENKSEITRGKLLKIIENMPNCSEDLKSLVNGDFLWRRIKSIEEVGSGEFVEIEVDKNHSYVGNGLISHNCNLPARRVIIAHTTFGLTPMEVCDIDQMSGRSGRPAYDQKGDVYIMLPSSQVASEIERIRKGFVVKSNICDVPNLVFNVVSEVMIENIQTKDDFYNWYKHTLAHIQGVCLTKNYCDEVFNKLEMLKMISKEEVGGRDTYKITALGQIPSFMYQNPYDVYYWYKNFSNINDINSKRTTTTQADRVSILKTNEKVATALANCYEYKIRRPFASKAERETSNMEKYLKYARRSPDGVSKIGACYFALMNGDEIDSAFRSTISQLKFDLERTIETLKIIHLRHGKLACKKGYQYHPSEWNALFHRIMNGVPYQLCPLVTIEGIGKKRAQNLYKNGIRNKRDILSNVERCKTVLGEKLADNIINSLSKHEKL